MMDFYVGHIQLDEFKLTVRLTRHLIHIIWMQRNAKGATRRYSQRQIYSNLFEQSENKQENANTISLYPAHTVGSLSSLPA